MASGIDRVIVFAPDTVWSKEIIAQVIDRFTLLSNNKTTFILEAVYYVDN
jgi:hypothetical protein